MSEKDFVVWMKLIRLPHPDEFSSSDVESITRFTLKDKIEFNENHLKIVGPSMNYFVPRELVKSFSIEIR